MISHHDYQPFGEELFAGMGSRTTAQGYSSPNDSLRQRFTGKERDNETGLDYFGARYYASTQGRFTSADELLNSGRLEDPQTWNRYSYTLNNPLVYTDPTGMYTCADSKKCDSAADIRFEAQRQRALGQLDKIKERYGPKSAEYTDAKRAVEAYGNPGEANGVTVSFGKTSDGSPGESTGHFAKDFSKSINVTIDMDQNKDDNALLGSVVHKGSHVQDRADLVSGILAAGSDAEITALAAGFTHGATETRAYNVQSVFAEFTLKNEQPAKSGPGTFSISVGTFSQQNLTLGKTLIWNPSWAGADVAKIRDNRSKAIAKGLSEDKRYKDKLNKSVVKLN